MAAFGGAPYSGPDPAAYAGAKEMTGSHVDTLAQHVAGAMQELGMPSVRDGAVVRGGRGQRRGIWDVVWAVPSDPAHLRARDRQPPAQDYIDAAGAEIAAARKRGGLP